MTDHRLLLMLPLVVASACQYHPWQIENPWHKPMKVTVTNVVDGDTIDVDPPVPIPIEDMEGIEDPRPERIRPMCINTPEVGACYSREATRFLEDRILGEEVLLIFDEDSLGHYGRAVAYVKHRGTLINLLMAEEGYATPPGEYWQHYTWCPDILDAMEEAMEAGRGGWGACQGETWELD